MDSNSKSTEMDESSENINSTTKKSIAINLKDSQLIDISDRAINVEFYSIDANLELTCRHLSCIQHSYIVNEFVCFFRQYLTPRQLVAFVWSPSASTAAAIQAFLILQIQFLPVKSVDDIVPDVAAILCLSECKVSNGWPRHKLQLSHCFDAYILWLNLNSQMPQEDDFAYVITTSGSTGKAKLVHVPRQCIDLNVNDFHDRFKLKPNKDKIILCAPLTFDTSIVDILLCLSTGVDLIIMSEKLRTKPCHFCQVYHIAQPTYMQCTPSFFRNVANASKSLFLDSDSSLRFLVLGGERFPSLCFLTRHKSPSNTTQIFNIYGITEMSSWASIFLVPDSWIESSRTGSSDRNIPLGVPLTDVDMTVKSDESDEVLDECIRGELCLHSNSRWTKVNGKILTSHYTGDLVLQIGDEFFYEGRISGSWMKRFGLRVGFSDALRGVETIDGILHATVLFDNEEIVLIVQCCDGCSVDEQMLGQIYSKMSKFHVPDRIVEVEAMLMSPHDKLLSTMDAVRSGRLVADLPLLPLWAAYTGQKPNRVDSRLTFIESGGDSLSALMLAHRISKTYPLKEAEALQMLLTRRLEEIDIIWKFDVKNLIQNEKDEVSHNLSANVSHTDSSSTLSVKWRYHLGRCIDAPVCIHNGTAFIGCHSHRFAAIQISSGIPLWDIELPDRIEAGALVSLCERFVLVGCHNGMLYILKISDGSIYWSYQTNDIIKATPYQDDATGLVLIGSHDHLIHCLDIFAQRMIWKKSLDGSGIASAPTKICSSSACVTSLGGSVARIQTACGDLLWKIAIEKPIFAPACVFEGRNGEKIAAVGSVDNYIYALNSDNGQIIWRFATDGPVFVMPILDTVSDGFLISSHDGILRRINPYSGHLQSIIYRMKSSIYARPLLCKDIIALISTDGFMVMVDRCDNEVKAQYQFPAQIFSSPSYLSDVLVVGCRDDYLYCIDISILSEVKNC